MSPENPVLGFVLVYFAKYYKLSLLHDSKYSDSRVTLSNRDANLLHIRKDINTLALSFQNFGMKFMGELYMNKIRMLASNEIFSPFIPYLAYFIPFFMLEAVFLAISAAPPTAMWLPQPLQLSCQSPGNFLRRAVVFDHIGHDQHDHFRTVLDFFL